MFHSFHYKSCIYQCFQMLVKQLILRIHHFVSTSVNSDVLQEQTCRFAWVTCFSSYWFLATLCQALQIGAFIQFSSAQFNTSLLNPCTANCKWQLATHVNRKTHRWEQEIKSSHKTTLEGPGHKYKSQVEIYWASITSQSSVWMPAFSFIVFLFY